MRAVARACAIEIKLAPVGEATRRSIALSCTASQTALCEMPRASGCAALRLGLAPPKLGMRDVPAGLKNADLRDQRPCSTQETGIRSEVLASTSTLTFRMRFCFAPTSSSPS